MEQKHFKYEGNAKLKVGKTPDEVKIKGVEFFVPVRVYMEVDGKSVHEMAHMDYANKRLFFDNNSLNTQEIKDDVFNFLLNVTSQPVDMFEAGNEVYDEVDRVYEEHEKMKQVKESEQNAE